MLAEYRITLLALFVALETQLWQVLGLDKFCVDRMWEYVRK